MSELERVSECRFPACAQAYYMAAFLIECRADNPPDSRWHSASANANANLSPKGPLRQNKIVALLAAMKAMELLCVRTSATPAVFAAPAQLPKHAEGGARQVSR